MLGAQIVPKLVVVIVALPPRCCKRHPAHFSNRPFATAYGTAIIDVWAAMSSGICLKICAGHQMP